ncbi:predicted protein [Botrytis cinerea T4]|uniref:Uncharacterized protein n=1 Tax=Botryotinia fuckeliana (strain T4) TaxID=999810 RepID=G2XZJ9_BOTF4|nr:predicted protein [Botrytis cinerea T4]
MAQDQIKSNQDKIKRTPSEPDIGSEIPLYLYRDLDQNVKIVTYRQFKHSQLNSGLSRSMPDMQNNSSARTNTNIKDNSWNV